jgi:hypothetical protein
VDPLAEGLGSEGRKTDGLGVSDVRVGGEGRGNIRLPMVLNVNAAREVGIRLNL